MMYGILLVLSALAGLLVSSSASSGNKSYLFQILLLINILLLVDPGPVLEALSNFTFLSQKLILFQEFLQSQ